MLAKPGNRLLLRIAEYKVNGKDPTESIQNSVSIYNFTNHEAVLFNQGKRTIIYPNTGYSFERPTKEVSLTYNNNEFVLNRSHFRKKMHVLTESEEINYNDMIWTEKIWMRDIWKKSDLMIPDISSGVISFIPQEGAGNYPILILGLIFLFVLIMAVIVIVISNKLYNYVDTKYISVLTK